MCSPPKATQLKATPRAPLVARFGGAARRSMKKSGSSVHGRFNVGSAMSRSFTRATGKSQRESRPVWIDRLLRPGGKNRIVFAGSAGLWPAHDHDAGQRP